MASEGECAPTWRSRTTASLLAMTKHHTPNLRGKKRTVYALKGQPARSPGQSEAAPWVMWQIGGFRPERAKAYIIWCDRMDALPVSLRFCPFRAKAGDERQYPGRRFALPWAGRRLPFQGVPPTRCTMRACYFHFNWGALQPVLALNSYLLKDEYGVCSH